MSNVLKGMVGLVFAISLRRSAEILRDPSKSSAEERNVLADILDKMGKEGIEQESLKIATTPEP